MFCKNELIQRIVCRIDVSSCNSFEIHVDGMREETDPRLLNCASQIVMEQRKEWRNYLCWRLITATHSSLRSLFWEMGS